MKKRKKHNRYKKYFPLVICILILAMSIGYAVINSVILELDGQILSNLKNGVLISSAQYKTRENALPNENAQIITHNNTTLSSTVTLEPNDPTSIVYIEVNLYNNSNKSYLLNDVSYNPSIEGTYTNPYIKFEIEELSNYVIQPNSSMSVNLKFSYNEPANLNNNVVSTILKFEFVEYIAGRYITPGIHEFVAPQTGTYKLETWGASGGDVKLSSAADPTKLNFYGGNGGYSSGEVTLSEGEKIYVVVGGEGNSSTTINENLTGGYNGGGNVVSNENSQSYTATGGGATHMATVSGLLQELYSNQNNILLVAGGGGGSLNQENNTDSTARFGNGGAGGGENGVVAITTSGTGELHTCSTCSSKQTGQATMFGKGEDSNGTSSGGGGYYGGVSGNTQSDISGNIGSGSGGAGYIDGVDSGNTIPGNQLIPTYNNPNMIYGNDGNGHAKISLISSTTESPQVNIHSAQYKKRTDSLTNESATIMSYSGTSLTSQITLEPNNTTSEVSIILKIHNPTKSTYYLKEITTDTSTNSNIKYSYTNTPEALLPNQEMTVTIKFKYISSANLSQNTLESTLILGFSETKIIPNYINNNASDIIIFDTEQNSEGIVLNGENSYANFQNTVATEFPLTYSITFKSNKTSGLLFGDYTTRAAAGIIEKRIVINLAPPGGESRTSEYELTNSLTPNEWYTFDIVYTSLTSQKIYLNGVQVTKKTNKSNYWVWGKNLSYIGTRPISTNYTTAYNFNGTIKRFMIYDKALTQEEIQYNYATDDILTDQLAIYYDFALKE